MNPVVERIDSRFKQSAALLEQAVGIPFVRGNKIQILHNGDEIFPPMLAAIESARQRIDFATFVYWQGPIAERFAVALAKKAQAGLTVRVLLDAYGAMRIERRLIRLLRNAGAQVEHFRPLRGFRIWRWDKRSHRKILICDDSVAFTGGVGIAQEWEGNAQDPSQWRDTHVAIYGPAIIQLRSAFLDNWNEAAPWRFDANPTLTEKYAEDLPVQVIRSSTTIGWTDAATMLRSLISVAQSTVRITTAYFNPDRRLLELLLAILRRNATVQLLLPGRFCDSRLSQLAGYWAVEHLLAAGANVYEYEPTMLHAKIMTVDGFFSCIGSSNFNHRSMAKDEELSIIVGDSNTAKTLDRQFEQDLSRSRELTHSQWRDRGAWLRLKERLARSIVEQL